MAYQTQNDRIKEYFMNNIYSQLGEFGIEYNKLIVELRVELGVTEKAINEFLSLMLLSGTLVETRIFDLPKEELEKRKKEKMKILEEELERAGVKAG